MSKIPKKIPPWISKFAEFAKSKERKLETKQAIDVFTQILTNRWDNFLEANAKEQEEKVPRQRNVDPIKTLGRAFSKVAEQVEGARENPVLVQHYKERVKQTIPPILTDTFQVSNAPHQQQHQPQENKGDIVSLVDEASQGLVEIEQYMKQCLSGSDSTPGDSDSADSKAFETLTAVSQNLEQIKDSLM